MSRVRHLAFITDEFEYNSLVMEYFRLRNTLTLYSPRDEEESVLRKQDRLRLRIEELRR